MAHSFVIDSLPESAARYRDTHALAVVDVFRATTCIVTALFRGHAVYPVATIGEAVTVAGGLRDAYLRACRMQHIFRLENIGTLPDQLRGQ